MTVPAMIPMLQRTRLLREAQTQIRLLNWREDEAHARESLHRIIREQIVPAMWSDVLALAPTKECPFRGLRVDFDQVSTRLLATPMRLRVEDVPDCDKPGCLCGGRAVAVAALQRTAAAVLVVYRVQMAEGDHFFGNCSLGAAGGSA